MPQEQIPAKRAIARGSSTFPPPHGGAAVTATVGFAVPSERNTPVPAHNEQEEPSTSFAPPEAGVFGQTRSGGEEPQPSLKALEWDLERLFTVLMGWRVAARNSLITAVNNDSLDYADADALARAWEITPLPGLWQLHGVATVTYLHRGVDPEEALADVHRIVPSAVRAALNVLPEIEVRDVLQIEAPAPGQDGSAGCRLYVAVGVSMRVVATSEGDAVARANAGLYGETSSEFGTFEALLSPVAWTTEQLPEAPMLHVEPLGSGRVVKSPAFRMVRDRRRLTAAVDSLRGDLESLQRAVPGLPRTRRIDVATTVNLDITADSSGEAGQLSDCVTESTYESGEGWWATGGGVADADDPGYSSDGRFRVRARRYCSVFFHARQDPRDALAEARVIAAEDLTSVTEGLDLTVTPVDVAVADRGLGLVHDLISE